MERMTVEEQSRALTPLREEEKKAVQRIGKGSLPAIAWLLRFAQMDLSKLSEGQWSDLAAELSAFAHGMITMHVADPFSRNVDAHWWEASPRGPKSNPDVTRFPSKEAMAKLQVKLKSALDNLLQFHDMHFPAIELTLDVYDARFFELGIPAAEAKQRGALDVRARRLDQTFFFHAAIVFAEHVPKVKSCPECQTVFASARKDQLFCTTKCLNRVTQREFRKRQRSATERGKKRTR